MTTTVRERLCEGCQGSGVAPMEAVSSCDACDECNGCGYYDCPCEGLCHADACGCGEGDDE